MSNVLEQLRENTHSLHEQTEQLLFAESLRGGSLSANEYVQLLLTHFTYHRALETAIDQHTHFFAPYDPDSRKKTSWLQADLTQLQQTLPTLTPVFANWSTSELLGAAYVGEGSMLGGKTVWHYLQQSPAVLPLLENARFYRGYGAETGQRWKTFVAFLTEQPTDQIEAIVKGARNAFLTYHSLFHEVQRQWTPQAALV